LLQIVEFLADTGQITFLITITVVKAALENMINYLFLVFPVDMMLTGSQPPVKTWRINSC